RGSIAVKKVTVPASDTTTTFSFSGNAGAQSLTNGQTSTAVSVAPGTYTETEGSKTGWDLTALSCDDGNSTGDISTGIATFRVAAGENVVGTFTNSRKPQLIVKKQVINDNGGAMIATQFAFVVNNVGFPISFLQDGTDTLKGKNTLTVDPGTYTIV